ncbi:MAG: ABC transporter permease [Rickettsiales bacterium]|jgi:putrescine transport system permease protein|nr:ABC transporter permease [Rickettsiales bacterium]
MNIGIFDRYRTLIIVPPLLWVGLFIVVALILLLVISFSEPEFGITPYKSFLQLKDGKLEISPFFEGYKVLFQDSFYLKALANSIKLALISTIFTFLLAYPMAYVMYRATPKQRLLLLILTIAPFWTALLIRIYGWIIILKPQGLLNDFLLWIRIIDEPLNLLNTQTAVVIGIVYTYLPFMILPIYSSLLKIKENILEAAADLGSKPLSIFWKITFPLSIPGVVVGIVLVFIPAVGEFVIPDLLGGAKVITVGKLLWTEFFMNRDWPMAAAITILMVLIVLIPIKILHYFYGDK